MVQGRHLWISFKYVKLPEFCYDCGKLGHTLKDCEMVDPSVDEVTLQCGECLRGSPIKSLQRTVELERSEEKFLFLAYYKANPHSKLTQRCTLLPIPRL